MGFNIPDHSRSARRAHRCAPVLSPVEGSAGSCADFGASVSEQAEARGGGLRFFPYGPPLPRCTRPWAFL